MHYIVHYMEYVEVKTTSKYYVPWFEGNLIRKFGEGVVMKCGAACCVVRVGSGRELG